MCVDITCTILLLCLFHFEILWNVAVNTWWLQHEEQGTFESPLLGQIFSSIDETFCLVGVCWLDNIQFTKKRNEIAWKYDKLDYF